MSEERTRLSYENGLLSAEISQMRAELESLPELMTELTQVRKNCSTAEQRNSLVFNSIQTFISILKETRIEWYEKVRKI